MGCAELNAATNYIYTIKYISQHPSDISQHLSLRNKLVTADDSPFLEAGLFYTISLHVGPIKPQHCGIIM